LNFFSELKHRNVFKVAAAYIIVGWLVMQVGDTLGPSLLLPGWINSALGYFAFDKFVLDPGRDKAEIEAAVQSAAQDSTPAASDNTASDKSIAVLPFVNMSSDGV